MKSTRLFELLSSLDNREFIRLGEFLDSPFLNKNRQVLSFYYFLSGKQNHPEYSGISRDEIFKYVYIGQEYDPDKYLKLSSDFVKAVEKFMVYEFREKKTLYNKRILLEISRERNLSKTFEKYFKELDESGGKNLNKDLDYYLMEYETKVEAMLYNLNKKKFNLEKALLDINDTVDVMIASNKLDLFIKLPDYSIDKARETFWLKNEVVIFVDGNKDYFQKNHLLIYMKRLILRMLEDKDENAYAEFKRLVNNNRKNIKKENLIYLYDKMLTFCSMMNMETYKSEEFQILKTMEETSLLFYGSNYIDYNYFLNIVDCALNENQPYWAEKFINEYQNRISDDFKESTANLAKATLNIYKHKFNEALENVSWINSKNDFFYLSVKIMSIVIYFELDEEKSVQYTIDATRNFLLKRKNSKELDYSSHNNFLIYVRKISIIKNKPVKSKNEILNVIDGIENENLLINKDWLLRKGRSIEFGKRVFRLNKIIF
ncbi:MAG: hypothetical protein ABI840_13175 [bacterium]